MIAFVSRLLWLVVSRRAVLRKLSNDAQTKQYEYCSMFKQQRFRLLLRIFKKLIKPPSRVLETSKLPPGGLKREFTVVRDLDRLFEELFPLFFYAIGKALSLIWCIFAYVKSLSMILD